MLLTYDRCWALDDIVVRSGGDGRTVEAYAAVFDTPAEIRDQHGHYVEVIDRTAFNRQIGLGTQHVSVFYNHGMDLHGGASPLGAVPIGHPEDIVADGRGLRTVTRFNRSDLAEAALEAIRNGDIRGYSFRGRVHKSNPTGVPRGRSRDLPTIRRMELGLTEYGPTPTPAYAGAGILAVRSVQTLAADLTALADEQRDELIRLLSSTTPEGDQETTTTTPEPGPGAEDQPQQRHSGRLAIARARIRAEAYLEGVLNGTPDGGEGRRGN